MITQYMQLIIYSIMINFKEGDDDGSDDDNSDEEVDDTMVSLMCYFKKDQLIFMRCQLFL